MNRSQENIVEATTPFLEDVAIIAGSPYVDLTTLRKTNIRPLQFFWKFFIVIFYAYNSTNLFLIIR